jgi:hypothetical protein
MDRFQDGNARLTEGRPAPAGVIDYRVIGSQRRRRRRHRAPPLPPGSTPVEVQPSRRHRCAGHDPRAPPPPIGAPCTQCLRHGDLIHARKSLTGAALSGSTICWTRVLRRERQQQHRRSMALAALLTESVALVSPLESPSRGFCAAVPSVAKHRHTGRRSQSAIVWGRRATRRGRTKAARRRLVTLLVIALPTCEPSILLLFSFSCSLL